MPDVRRLVLFRHAKSAYPDGVDDHDRPLGPRGVSDARAAGRWIRSQLGQPDQVVVSTARRARGTWTLAAEAVGYIGAAGYDIHEVGPLVIDARIYQASAQQLLEVAREIPDRARFAIIVGHVPGVSDFADALAGSGDRVARDAMAQKYPTSALAVLEYSGSWAALDVGQARLVDFAVPRGDE